MKENKALWAAILAALPPLMLAAAGWLDAHSEKEAKLNLADNYRQYIEEQMGEDSGLKDSLDSCLRTNEHLVEAIRGGGPVPASTECAPCPELQPTSSVAAAPGD